MDNSLIYISFFRRFLFIAAVILFLFSGCKKDEILNPPDDNVNTGTADFSSFVILGNSLSAGMQSNSLYQSAQEYSFGNLIAKQVKTNFVQPLISDPGTGGRIELSSIDPLKISVNLNSGSPVNNDYVSSFNNLGVPGAYIYDIVNASNKQTSYAALGGGAGNALFDLILRGKGTEFQQAKLLKPTFMIVWIGNNDILGHAVSGGIYPATSIVSFESLYRQMADSIASLKTQVIVGNIVDVTSIPYFSTFGIQLQLKGINSVWGINGSGDTVLMDLQKNYVTLRGGYEELYDAQGNPTGRGNSRSLPVRNQYILDEIEVKNVNEIVNKYNEIISSVASQKGFTLVDFNLLFKTIKATERLGGYVVDGQIFTTLYYYGNLFSLDGSHPSSQGYAIIANEFIKTINQKYNATIPLIKVSEIKNNFTGTN